MEALKIRHEFKPYRGAPVNRPTQNSAVEHSWENVSKALENMLSSSVFRRCKRLSGLMYYVVKKHCQGASGDLNEYGIGIEYYRRDPRSYNTTEDPIVRVQIGRLREKLKLYYAGPGQDADLCIAIPVGSYVPVITTTRRGQTVYRCQQPIVFMPLNCIGGSGESNAFTQGLNEELGYHLFSAFGTNVYSHLFGHLPVTTQANEVMHALVEDGYRANVWTERRTTAVKEPVGMVSGRGASPSVQQAGWAREGYWLEGGVRTATDHVKVNLRIIAAPTGCVVWSQQFERRAALSIDLQEELAAEISAAAKTYLNAR